MRAAVRYARPSITDLDFVSDTQYASNPLATRQCELSFVKRVNRPADVRAAVLHFDVQMAQARSSHAEQEDADAFFQITIAFFVNRD